MISDLMYNFYSKAAGFAAICRPLNFVLSFISIWAAVFICGSETADWDIFLLASLSGALVGSAGNIINDYFDVEIDRINRPERPLPSGIIKQRSALSLYFVALVSSLILAALLSFSAFMVAASAGLLIFIYSFRLKRVLLAGNFLVAGVTGFAFIYGGIAAGNWKAGIIPAVFAFLVNLIREIVKDVEDLAGDSAENTFTFPYTFGIEKSRALILLLILLTMALTPFPFILGLYSIEYFIFIMLTVNVIFVYIFKVSHKLGVKSTAGRISSMLKLNMFFGLLAIILGNY